MPTEVAVGDQLRRPASAAAASGKSQPSAAAAEQEHLPCPRCDSTNTKFCYYNNYNFSQPRHFCKACRRYWTHGGTLRDIPVGGGSRKNAKRSRTSSGGGGGGAPLAATPVMLPPMGSGGGGGFTSLLNTQGPGFLALGGFGLGLGSGLVEELGFGLGRGIWALGGPEGGGVRGMGGATWQYEGGDHHNHNHHLIHHHGHGHVAAAGGAVGDFCSWPETVVSTPGSALK